MRLNKRKSFSMLELVIVVFVIGLIISIALPRLMKSIDFSTSTEALVSISSIHQAMERCYPMRGDYEDCLDFEVLTMDDPSKKADSNFDYELNTPPSESGIESYMVIASLRESLNRSSCGNVPQTGKIIVRYFKSHPAIRCGEGIYSDLGSCENIYREL